MASALYPKPFVVACDKFVYTEVLRKVASTVPEDSTTTQPALATAQVVSATSTDGESPDPDEAVAASPPKPLESPVNLISQAIEQGADESGWAALGIVGNYLTKIQPDFDPRLYGCRKPSDLVRKFPESFEISERGAPESPSKVIFARVSVPEKSAKSSG